MPFIKPLPDSLENMISSSVLVHACAFLLQKQFPSSESLLLEPLALTNSELLTDPKQS